MPYPFIFFPTWAEIIDRLKNEHQIAFQEIEGHQYFERPDGLPVVVSFDDPKERPVPSEMRSLCQNLGISPKFFGLDLPEPDWEESD